MTSKCQKFFGHHILPRRTSPPIPVSQQTSPMFLSKMKQHNDVQTKKVVKLAISWSIYCNYPRIGLSPQEGIHETNFYWIYIMWQEHARLAWTKPHFCLWETQRVVREAAISLIKTVVTERLPCPDLVPGTEGTPANKTDKSPKLQGVSILVEGDRQ